MRAKWPIFLLLALTLLRTTAVAQDGSLTANSNALPDAKAILKYLRNLPLQPEKKLISGQFESWGRAVMSLSSSNNNLEIVHEKTGKWVGLVGVEYHQGGVFPEAPDSLCTESGTRAGWSRFNLIMRNPAAPEASNGGGRCDADLVLNPNHEYHRFFFHELDEVAAGLEELQKQGVVVFLNPFAEANADWFWWGGQSPEKFKALYRNLRLSRSDKAPEQSAVRV